MADDDDGGGNYFMGIEEVAKLLHTSKATIYRKRGLGEFCPAYQFGLRLLWKRSEMLRWMEQFKDDFGTPPGAS